MLFPVGTRVEPLGTENALKGFDPAMDPLMDRQVRFLPKLLPALLTLIRLYPGVDLAVSGHILPVLRGERALAAFEHLVGPFSFLRADGGIRSRTAISRTGSRFISLDFSVRSLVQCAMTEPVGIGIAQALWFGLHLALIPFPALFILRVQKQQILEMTSFPNGGEMSGPGRIE